MRNNDIAHPHGGQEAPALSFLLAVYNAAPFLAECLESVLAQTRPDWQVVAVDDGSTDGSLEVLNRYAARDERLLVLSNGENRGLSYTRNRALHRARGQYVMMLDADDRLSPDVVEAVVEAFDADPEADVALMHLMYWDYPAGSTHEYVVHAPLPMTGRVAFELSLDWRIHGVFAVRRSYHLKYPYDESAKLYSDDNTPRIHFLHARHVVQARGCYYYRRHASSLTHRVSVRRFDYLTANLSLRRTLLAEGVDRTALSRLERHRWLNWLAHARLYLGNQRTFTHGERREIVDTLRRTLASMDLQLLPRELMWRQGALPTRHYGLQMAAQRLYLWLRPAWQCFKGGRRHG